MEASDFGSYLKRIRKEKKLTIRQLELYSKVSNAYISQMERGERGVPSPEILKKLSKPLGVSYEDLMMAAGHLTTDEELDIIIDGHKKFIDYANDEENKKYKNDIIREANKLLSDENMKKFINEIDLKDDQIIKKVKFLYDGKSLSEDKAKQLISFIRFLVNESEDK